MVTTEAFDEMIEESYALIAKTRNLIDMGFIALVNKMQTKVLANIETLEQISNTREQARLIADLRLERENVYTYRTIQSTK